MKLSVTVDTGELEAKLYLLGKAIGAAPGVVFREETKGIAQQIIKLTPPRNLAQGRRAVENDLSRIVYAPSSDTVSWLPLKNAIAKRNIASAEKLFANKRAPSFTFTTSQSDIAAQHIKMRTRRGRINRGVKPILATFPSEAKSYIRTVQSRVGWAKGAWVSTLQAAGGTAPSWISKYAMKAGNVIADFGENPKVHAFAHNIKIPGYQKLVDTAVATRVRITQRKIDAIVAGRGVNLGFAVVLTRQ